VNAPRKTEPHFQPSRFSFTASQAPLSGQRAALQL
jgi:hypothetical protein